MPFIIDTSNKSVRFFTWVLLLFHLAILTKFIIFKKPLGFVKRHLVDLTQHYRWKSFKTNIHDGHLNIKPFHTIKMYMADNMPVKLAFLNLIGNVAGFIPLGILLPFLFIRLRSVFATTAAVFFISCCFELLQLFGMLGVCDIDDLILNTLGGMIGYFIFWLMTTVFEVK